MSLIKLSVLVKCCLSSCFEIHIIEHYQDTLQKLPQRFTYAFKHYLTTGLVYSTMFGSLLYMVQSCYYT